MRFERAPERNSDNVIVAVGADFHPRALISGSGRIGIRRFLARGAAVRDISSVIAEAELSYRIAGRTVVTFRAEREIRYSFQRASSYFVVTATGLGVTRRLGRRLDLSGRVTGNWYDYQTARQVRDTRWNAIGAFGYRVNPELRIGFEGGYRKAESTTRVRGRYRAFVSVWCWTTISGQAEDHAMNSGAQFPTSERASRISFALVLSPPRRRRVLLPSLPPAGGLRRRSRRRERLRDRRPGCPRNQPVQSTRTEWQVHGRDRRRVLVSADRPHLGRRPDSEQLEATLRTRLLDGYFRDPRITVAVAEYRSRQVFVMGKCAVRAPIPGGRDQPHRGAGARGVRDLRGVRHRSHRPARRWPVRPADDSQGRDDNGDGDNETATWLR